MAIYSSVPPPDQQPQPAPASASVQQQAPPPTTELPIRGTTGVTLSIPLDDHQQPGAEERSARYKPRKEPLRRDSLKRREALLRGKEGSRRRQRWENGSSP